MKKTTFTFLVLIVIHLSLKANPKRKDYLETCWKKQVEKVQSAYLSFSFKESINNFDHGTEPFQVRSYNGKGLAWVNADHFLKSDTLAGGRDYFSKTQWSTSEFLFLDYGDEKLFEVTYDMHQILLFQNARYTPVNLIDYFVKRKAEISAESTKEIAVYSQTINKSIVKLFIRKSDSLVEKISILSDTDFINDELFGDILIIVTYGDYTNVQGLFHPSVMSIDKMNGKLKEEVKLTALKLVANADGLLEKPEGYKLLDKPETKPEVTVERYSNNIHFVQLAETDDKSLIVEFADFLLIAEAPLNSRYGELIINEAKKIAPHKPIRYFVFGHFHTHYIGGVRAFVHKNATILATKNDVPYVEYIVNAPHTLNPDSLQLQPKQLKMEEVAESKTITDGQFEMKIYFIGDKSQHTSDYLIYYFPSEQLLFEDDLVWIAKEGPIRKASGRQAGLYTAVKDLGLTVKTIVQSWPVKDYGVKTVIPFDDLEASMNVK